MRKILALIAALTLLLALTLSYDGTRPYTTTFTQHLKYNDDGTIDKYHYLDQVFTTLENLTDKVNLPALPSIQIPGPIPYPEPSVPADGLSAFEQEVIDLVNAERAKAGLQPLAADLELTRVARLKSQDMRDSSYFDHISPNYGSPFDMMDEFGITYRAAGENIAAGQRTPAETMEGWMNSPGHKANILKSEFTHIGVGYTTGGEYRSYWTQMFVGR